MPIRDRFEHRLHGLQSLRATRWRSGWGRSHKGHQATGLDILDEAAGEPETGLLGGTTIVAEFEETVIGVDAVRGACGWIDKDLLVASSYPCRAGGRGLVALNGSMLTVLACCTQLQEVLCVELLCNKSA